MEVRDVFSMNSSFLESHPFGRHLDGPDVPVELAQEKRQAPPAAAQIDAAARVVGIIAMKEPVHAARTGKDRTQFRMTRDEARQLLVEPITFHLVRDGSNLLLRKFGRSEETI